MLKSWNSSWRHWPSSGFGVISRIAPRAFGEELGDDQARLDGLSQADLVGEDAAALAQPGEGEDDRIDLVRVGVDLRRALGGGVTALLVGAAQAHEILRKIANLRRMAHAALFALRSGERQCENVRQSLA